jgi:DNA-binding GntR family transcriptional regulator
VESLGSVRAIDRVDGDHAAIAAHEHLRRLILRGDIAPGTALLQGALAVQLGISRTPVREAIRMLQEEGLVVAEPQKRARVAPFDAGIVEAAYVQRVLLEGLGTVVTTRDLSPDRRDELTALTERICVDVAPDDLQAWQADHRRFHVLLISRLGPPLARQAIGNMESSERFRRLAQARGGSRWAKATEEHAAISAAVLANDGDAAAELLTIHLARTALELIVELAPAYDPYALRGAMSIFSRR